MIPFFPALFVLFLLAIVVSFLVTFGIRRIFIKIGILDRPHLYPVEGDRPPAPYSLGVVLWITLVIMSPLIFFFFDFNDVLSQRFMIFLVLGGLVTAISFLDDMDTIGKIGFSIPPWVRLLFQILIGLIVGITSIKISYLSNIFGDGIILLDQYFFTFHLGEMLITVYYIPVLVTIFWYVLVMNALNWSDGIPGLTGGFSLVSFLILTGLAVKLYLLDATLPSQENSRFVLALLMILIPTTFFLTRQDIHRTGLMGDSGTMMLAFSLATLSIIAGGKIATAVAVLGIYLVDLFYVISMRILSGKNPMKGDRIHHLHYRLMELGLSQSVTRNFIFALSFLFGISAIFLDTKGKIILVIGLGILVIFLTKILTLIEGGKKRKTR